MSETVLADLFREMFLLVETRKLGMTADEFDKAMAWIASLSALCAAATIHCNQMHFSDSQARHYMRGLLSGIVDRTRLDMGMTIESNGVLH